MITFLKILNLFYQNNPTLRGNLGKDLLQNHTWLKFDNKLYGSVSYYSGKSGIGVADIYLPSSCDKPYKVGLLGFYTMGSMLIDPKTGHSFDKMKAWERKTLPISDINIYGIRLINNQTIPDVEFISNSINVNINISQTPFGFGDVDGKITVNFYN